MPYLPHPHARQRAPRVKFAESTPVVLRSPDGKRSSGKLQVVSVTGGLLNLAQPLSQGSMLKLMFLTRRGPVLGAVEMLAPLSWDQQPFRFVNLFADDHSRLHAAIHSSIEQKRREDKQNQQSYDQLEPLRAW